MGILALRSNNISDVMQAINLGGWTNTRLSHRVQVGDTVLVFANMKVCEENGVDWGEQVVLAGRLVRRPYRLSREDERWPSNMTGTDNAYIARFDLEAMDLLPFSFFRQVRDDLRNYRGHLCGGRYYPDL